MQQEKHFCIDQLITTVNGFHNRVSMHGLRRELLEQQVKSVGIPLNTVELPEEPSMEEYDQQMQQLVDQLKADGYTDCGFGDIFLEDLRTYREQQLEGITCHFPIWKRDTKALIHEFIELGFKATVVCLNSELLDDSFLGREIDHQFIQDLPVNVDPCGENGEFHTFCYDGPIFSYPVSFTIGEKVLRKYKKPKQDAETESEAYGGFWFIDLVPTETE